MPDLVEGFGDVEEYRPCAFLSVEVLFYVSSKSCLLGALYAATSLTGPVARLTVTAVASMLMRSSARSAWCSMVDLTRMAVPPPRAFYLSVRWIRKFGSMSLLLALRWVSPMRTASSWCLWTNSSSSVFFVERQFAFQNAIWRDCGFRGRLFIIHEYRQDVLQMVG
ncbi:hypothetical protein Trydic_g658 [Trypoxylus dichotomus]